MVTSARPVKDKESFILSYKLWCQGDRQTDIVEKSGAPERTVRRWASWFKELPESELAKDRKFLTLKMDMSGISWRDADDFMDWEERFSAERLNTFTTVRQATWFWRLAQLSRGLSRLRSVLVDRIERHELETLLNQPTTETEEEISRAIKSFQKGEQRLPTPSRGHAQDES